MTIFFAESHSLILVGQKFWWNGFYYHTKCFLHIWKADASDFKNLIDNT